MSKDEQAQEGKSQGGSPAWTLEEAWGSNPEDIMENVFRRLVRFEFQCPLCGSQHTPEFYFSVDAKTPEEFQEKLIPMMDESGAIQNILPKSMLRIHDEKGDLDELVAQLEQARQEGNHVGSSPLILMTVMEESDYTCDGCGATFETIQPLREHTPECTGPNGGEAGGEAGGPGTAGTEETE